MVPTSNSKSALALSALLDKSLSSASPVLLQIGIALRLHIPASGRCLKGIGSASEDGNVASFAAETLFNLTFFSASGKRPPGTKGALPSKPNLQKARKAISYVIRNAFKGASKHSI